MCLLEVAMCEKCRNSHFRLEEGRKKFEDWGRVTFAGGEVSTPLHAMSDSGLWRCDSIGRLPVQTLLRTWPGLGIQPRCEFSDERQVETE